MQKARQMNLFPNRKRPIVDPSMVRIFVLTCVENYKDGIARSLPPHEIHKRKLLLQKMWGILDDARVRSK